MKLKRDKQLIYLIIACFLLISFQTYFYYRTLEKMLLVMSVKDILIGEYENGEEKGVSYVNQN